MSIASVIRISNIITNKQFVSSEVAIRNDRIDTARHLSEKYGVKLLLGAEQVLFFFLTNRGNSEYVKTLV